VGGARPGRGRCGQRREPGKRGGVYNATPPTYATGQVGELQLSVNGSLRAAALVMSITGLDNLSNNIGAFQRVDSQATTGPVEVAGFKFNGGGWDRDYKPRTASRLTSSAASNNATSVKASPGSVLGPITYAVTLATTGAYLKFFDGTGAPNPAAATPLYMFPLNYATGIAGVQNIPLPAGGLYFPTGISWAIVANPADLDNTSIAAGQIVALNIPYQ
jgi:hypothetical protein